ncbi:MAG: UPF0149 family protein [Gammaproteobacteria bacterium]|nr:UPF0149 family protein [Gammaproteobacteria bacterium]
MIARSREAEGYGMMAGVLAAGESPGAVAGMDAWVGFDSASPALLATDMLAALRARRFALPESLTDVSLPIALRVEQLAAWTRGFLSGLGQAGEALAALGDEGEEWLRNLEVVSLGARLEGAPDARAGREEARSLAELQEFLCGAAEFFYHALG